MPQFRTHDLLKNAQITGAGEAVPMLATPGQLVQKCIQVYIQGTGTVSATVVIEVCNNPLNPIWLPLATYTLSGTNLATDGATHPVGWKHLRANLTAINGTNAAVSVDMGA